MSMLGVTACIKGAARDSGDSANCMGEGAGNPWENCREQEEGKDEACLRAKPV